MNDIRKEQWIGYASSGVFSACQALLFVMYPVLAQRMNLSLPQVITCFSIGSFLFLWGAPYWSTKSDREGRKSILLVTQAAVLTSLLMLGILLLPIPINKELGFVLLLLSRVIYGAVGSGLVPVSQAMILDRSAPDQRIRSAATHSMFLNLGRLTGPIVGLLIASLAPFTMVLMFSFLFILLIVQTRSISPSMSQTQTGQSFSVRNLWPKTRDRQAVLVLAFLTTAFLGILQSSLGAYLQGQFHLSPALASQLMARLLIAGACTTVFVQFSMRKKLKDPWQGSLPAGASGLLLGSIVLLMSSTDLMLYGAVLLMSIGIALITPSYTSVLSIRSTGDQGQSAGNLSAAHTLGYAAGGGLSAIGLSLSIQLPFLLAFIISLAIFATLRPVYQNREFSDRKSVV